MIKCIFCNEDGFHWEKVSDEKWRLFKDDKIHDCRSVLDEKGNRLVICRYCNAGGFHWKKFDDEGWRLVKDDKIHDCRSDKSQPYYQEEDWEPEPIPPMCDSCDDYGCPHCNGDYSPT